MIFLLQKTLIFAIPLLIVALAGMFAERSGIINIALDGIMIFGAFAGALAAFYLRKNPYFVDNNQFLFVICLAIAAAAGAIFGPNHRGYRAEPACPRNHTVHHEGHSG